MQFLKRGTAPLGFLFDRNRAAILQQIGFKTERAFVDSVLDTAGQKGTGKWTSVNALDMGVPAPTIAEAVLLVVYLP